MPTPTYTPHTLKITVDDIVCVNAFLDEFWGNGGWASGDAAKLLTESRLDRQVELLRTLAIWLEAPTEHGSEGRLMLAWANLGALVEGAMKSFLCAFEYSYATALETDRHGNHFAPADVLFAKLCKYFAGNVWSDQQKQRFHSWPYTIHKLRYATNGYSNNPVGTWNAWQQSFTTYREFLDLAFQAPYPYEQFAMPAEVTQASDRVSAGAVG